MLQPQSKGNEILDALTGSILKGELDLLPIQVAGIKREISKLDNVAFKIHLRGILALLQGGDIHEAMELCERAISLDTSESLYWSNYIVALRNLGYLKKHNEFVRNSFYLIEYFPKRVSYELLSLGMLSLDFEIIQKTMQFLDKVGIKMEEIGIDGSKGGTIMLMCENTEQVTKLTPMVSHVFDVLNEQYNGQIAFLLRTDDGTMGYIFKVKLGLSDVERLNDELFDRLYDNDLLHDDCFVHIEAKE